MLQLYLHERCDVEKSLVLQGFLCVAIWRVGMIERETTVAHNEQTKRQKEELMTKNKRTGLCHICGENRGLTFEHIPPKFAGNSQSGKSYDVINMVKNGRFKLKDINGLRAKIHQQGLGDYTLCKSCNNYTGAHYVTAYGHAALAMHQYLNSIEETQKSDYIYFECDSLNVLAFFKQVIAMFCSINPAGKMIDCKDFLCDKDNTQFNDSKYRLNMVAIPDEKSNGWRSVVEKMVFKKESNDVQKQSFSVYLSYPFGFLLYTSDSSDIDCLGTDITEMSQYGYGNTPHFSLKLPCVKVDDVIPGFLRQ